MIALIANPCPCLFQSKSPRFIVWQERLGGVRQKAGFIFGPDMKGNWKFSPQNADTILIHRSLKHSHLTAHQTFLHYSVIFAKQLQVQERLGATKESAQMPVFWPSTLWLLRLPPSPEWLPFSLLQLFIVWQDRVEGRVQKSVLFFCLSFFLSDRKLHKWLNLNHVFCLFFLLSHFKLARRLFFGR